MEEFKFLSDSEIDAIINEYKGKIPSFLLDQIREKVKSKPITEEQLRKILEETAKEYKKEVKPIEELNEIRNLVAELHRIIKEFKERKVKEEKIEEKKPEKEEERKEEKKVEIGEPIIFERTKYRLEKLPNDATSIILAMKWLDFLLERVGLNNLSDVLEYYIDLGWISEDVHMQLMKLARGIKLIKEPDWKPTERLTLEDHIISLLFIERLRGVKISRDFLDKLYQEINFIKKAVERFYGV